MFTLNLDVVYQHYILRWCSFLSLNLLSVKYYRLLPEELGSLSLGIQACFTNLLGK